MVAGMKRYLLPTFLLALLLGSTATVAQTRPPGFVDEQVALVNSPTALAFTPDGRMLITQKGGQLRIYKNGALLAGSALDLAAAPNKICSGSEQGLLGVAVDPLFATNNYIYLFYTSRGTTNTCDGGGTYFDVNGNYSAVGKAINRVSRFTLGTDDLAPRATELILVNNMPSPGGNHNAGDVHFGKDGFLYISIGDGGTDWRGNSGSAGGNDAARDRHVLTGKILRITRDGNIPASNPFQGAGTGRCNVTGATTAGNHCQETFAWGLRNPFRFAMDPNAAGTRFYINDVGQGTWEEVDEGQSGADYGWNACEGRHNNGSTSAGCSGAPAGSVFPVYEYPRGTVPGTTVSGCASITGGAFVPNGVWPAAYDSRYLVADYVCGAVFNIATTGTPAVPVTTAIDFLTGLGVDSATSMRFGPNGGGTALYYTTFSSFGNGVDAIRRVRYEASGNTPPTVTNLAASPSSGPLPLNVNFTATASDPDVGNTLTYFWDFGDGQSATTTTSTTSHSYAVAGVYVASVRARDNNFAFSAAVTRNINAGGNSLPTAVITTPTAVATFAVGQTINLVGTGSDLEDGALPDSALSWMVRLRHAAHTHPIAGPLVGNNLSFVAPAPEDSAAALNSSVEIELTVTDSAMATNTVMRTIQPRIVNVNLATVPAGLKLDFNGVRVTTPIAMPGWENWQLNVNAPDQNLGANGQRFNTWSDAGTRQHAITLPATNSTLTANFNTGAFVPKLDVDNDGFVDAATDGVLILRYLLGFRGAPLIANAVAASGAERSSATAIAAYLAAIITDLDVEGDSITRATSDGLLIMRYLLGLSGTAFTNSAAQPGSRNAAQMQTYLNSLRP